MQQLTNTQTIIANGEISSNNNYQHLQNGNGNNNNNNYGKNSAHYQHLPHNGGSGNNNSNGNGHHHSTNYSSSTATSTATQHHHYQQLQQLQQQQQQHPHIYGSSAEDHYELTQAQYGHSAAAAAAGRTSGPNLVNKQLVLPFVPPSFPNNSQDGVTHLIKPSEYLKSISDKRSCPSSAR